MEMLTKLEVHRARSGPRAWPVQVQHVLQSKVRTSHCPRREAQARTCLGDHSDPDNPFRGTEMQVRLLKIINAALFTKGAGPGLVPPARPSDSHRGVGWGGCPSSVLVGKAKSASLWGQCSLLRPSWGSCPVAAGASTAVSGRHFQLWGPQEELQDAVGQERQAEVQEEDLGDDQLELWGRECW